MATVTRIEPPRGRAGDVLTIIGSGFSPLPGRNTVTLGGISAQVLSESAGVIQALAPAGLSEDLQERLLVTNLDDPTPQGVLHWFVLPPAGEILAAGLPAQQPSALEDPAVEVPGRAEAKDFERAAGLLGAIASDLLPSASASDPGAGRVGLDPDSLQGLELGARTVQAALEQLAAELRKQGVVAFDAGSVGNVGSGEDVLASVDIPAGTLKDIGDAVRVTAWGTIGLASGDSKRAILRVKFGGTDLGVEGVAESSGLPGFDTGFDEDWRVEALVLLSGSSSQEASAERQINGEPPLVSNTSPAEDPATAITVEVTGENATDSTDDVVVWRGLAVEAVRRRLAADTRALSDQAVASERTAVEVL